MQKSKCKILKMNSLVKESQCKEFDSLRSSTSFSGSSCWNSRSASGRKVTRFRIDALAPNLRGFVPEHATVAVLPDDPCVRCGYMWLSSDWLFGLFGKDDPMKAACKLHDDFFAEGREAGLTRKEVDELFWNAMTELTKKAGGKWWMYAQRNLYYGLARTFGGLFW